MMREALYEGEVSKLYGGSRARPTIKISKRGKSQMVMADSEEEFLLSMTAFFKGRLMVNQMRRAKGKGCLKWTPYGPNLPTAALTTPQKIWSIWELVKLKTFDLCDHTRTGIFILT